MKRSTVVKASIGLACLCMAAGVAVPDRYEPEVAAEVELPRVDIIIRLRWPFTWPLIWQRNIDAGSIA